MATKKSKILLGCLSLLGVLSIALLGLFLYMNESEPDGCKDQGKADQWANEIMIALDKPAWDSLGYISWDFTNRNQYAWDKQNNVAIITSGESKVIMQLDSRKYKAFNNGQELTGDEAAEASETAWVNWCNDSFWLSAHYKLNDAGTTRCIADLENGKEGLMVEYNSGGTTPGDKYLWIIDENNQPTAYKMWVKIIPVGGLEATWEDWLTLPGGAKIAQKHMIKSMNVSINDIKSGQNWSDLGYSTNPFQL